MQIVSFIKNIKTVANMMSFSENPEYSLSQRNLLFLLLKIMHKTTLEVGRWKRGLVLGSTAHGALSYGLPRYSFDSIQMLATSSSHCS